MSIWFNRKDNTWYGFSIYFSIGEWSGMFDEVDWGMREQKYAIEQGWGLEIKCPNI